MKPTPLSFLEDVISRWEGGYQSYADDAGNWVIKPDGTRIKIGTMRGVTPAALAADRGINPWSLTPEDMQAVTLEEAAHIGLKHYYLDPKFNALAWGPATAALLDFAWGSGPKQAALSMQRLVRVGADGAIGPLTAEAYGGWVANIGWALATDAVHDMRANFYRYICQVHPEDEQYLQGWLNRDDWVSRADGAWWDQWEIAA
jgi:lysozyme family protein